MTRIHALWNPQDIVQTAELASCDRSPPQVVPLYITNQRLRDPNTTNPIFLNFRIRSPSLLIGPPARYFRRSILFQCLLCRAIFPRNFIWKMNRSFITTIPGISNDCASIVHFDMAHKLRFKQHHGSTRVYCIISFCFICWEVYSTKIESSTPSSNRRIKEFLFFISFFFFCTYAENLGRNFITLQ